ncbi:hypothetical protein [Halobellus inordinatus]|uniref:hypothetical protein n=1 Tax=Halobellus inordinatus TaxID=1126236 RepID=UPI00210D0B00|nr:hypothetical protein [Halobellus inordinatus]
MSNPSEETAEQLIQYYEQYEQLEGTIQNLLDDLLRARISGNDTKVRQELRSLARSERDAYRFLMYSMNLDNSYEELLRGDSEGEEVLETAQNINQKYSRLLPSLSAAYLEVFGERLNPITSYDYEPGYRSEYAEPMIYFEASTGDLDLFETRVSSSVGLHLSRSIIEGINETLSTVIENDFLIDESEYENLVEVNEDIKEKVEEIDDKMESLETVSPQTNVD